jgi:hypothetical protein
VTIQAKMTLVATATTLAAHFRGHMKSLESRVMWSYSEYISRYQPAYQRQRTSASTCVRGSPRRDWGTAGHVVTSANLLECHSWGSCGCFLTLRRTAVAEAAGLQHREFPKNLKATVNTFSFFCVDSSDKCVTCLAILGAWYLTSFDQGILVPKREETKRR